jgi:hypothetical protein
MLQNVYYLLDSKNLLSTDKNCLHQVLIITGGEKVYRYTVNLFL